MNQLITRCVSMSDWAFSSHILLVRQINIWWCIAEITQVIAIKPLKPFSSSFADYNQSLTSLTPSRRCSAPASSSRYLRVKSGTLWGIVTICMENHLKLISPVYDWQPDRQSRLPDFLTYWDSLLRLSPSCCDTYNKIIMPLFAV